MNRKGFLATLIIAPIAALFAKKAEAVPEQKPTKNGFDVRYITTKYAIMAQPFEPISSKPGWSPHRQGCCCWDNPCCYMCSRVRVRDIKQSTRLVEMRWSETKDVGCFVVFEADGKTYAGDFPLHKYEVLDFDEWPDVKIWETWNR